MTWLSDIVAPRFFKNGTEHTPRREQIDFVEGAGMTLNFTDVNGKTTIEFVASTTVDPVITRITPPSLGSSQDNYSPTGWSGANTMRLASSVDVDIRGLDSTVTVERKIIYNIGNKTITLKFNDGGQDAGNLIVTPLGADFDLSPGEGMIIEKDPNASAWRVIETINAGVLLSTSFAGEVVQHGDKVDNVLTSGAPTDGGSWRDELKVNTTGLTVGSTAEPATPPANATRVFGTVGFLRLKDPAGVRYDMSEIGVVTKLLEFGRQRWDVGPTTTQVFNNAIAADIPGDDQFIIGTLEIDTWPVATQEEHDSSALGPSVATQKYRIKAWRGVAPGSPNAIAANAAVAVELEAVQDTSSTLATVTATYDGGTNQLRINVDRNTTTDSHASMTFYFKRYASVLTGGYNDAPP